MVATEEEEAVRGASEDQTVAVGTSEGEAGEAAATVVMALMAAAWQAGSRTCASQVGSSFAD